MIEHWQTAEQLTEGGTAFVVVTLLSARGHVPQEPGAKAIITIDGLHQGTIGGGKVEAKAIEFSRELLSAAGSKSISTPKIINWNLTTDVGMTCGGEVTFLFEVHNPKRWKVAVFGAGHVAQALVRTLQNLECHVTCLDSRAEWLSRIPDSRKITKILSGDLPAKAASFDSETFFVVMTQGHATDLPILESIYRAHPDTPYIGVMGSDVKAKKIRGDLFERGISEAQVDRLRSPIGLSIGGNRPFEIAISVAAELLQARSADESRE